MEGKAEKIHLQWIGQHPAVKASELKPGDITVWNGGATEKIIDVTPSKSGKTIKATIEYKSSFDGKKVRTTRKLSSDRLVGIDNSAKQKSSEPKKESAPAAKKEKTVRPNPFAGADDIYVTKNKIAVTKTKKAKAARGFKKTTQTKYYARNRRNVKQLKAVQGDTVREGRKGTKYTRL